MTARSRSGGASLSLLVCAIALIAGFVAASSSHAADPRPVFQMPFPCGEAWRVDSYPKHQPNPWATDWNWGTTGSADLGKPVLAGISGVVNNRNDAKGLVDVAVPGGGGWVTRYQHLQAILVSNGLPVGPLTQIGTVGKTGAVSPHLHYEQRLGGVPQPVSFGGVPITYVNSPNYVTYTSQNCGGGGGGSGTDLYYIKTKYTGSGKVEVHVATAASGYTSSGGNWASWFSSAEQNNSWFQVGTKGLRSRFLGRE